MKSANPVKSSANRGNGKPFASGFDPRRGRGAAALTVEQLRERKERKRLAEEARHRVIDDIALEMRSRTVQALETIERLMANGEDDVALRAAALALNYGFGKPLERVATLNLDASSDAEKRARVEAAMNKLKAVMAAQQTPAAIEGTVLRLVHTEAAK